MVHRSLGLFLLLSGLLLAPVGGGAQPVPEKSGGSWADSLMRTLTIEQKIAQLMMVRVHSNKNRAYNDTMVARMSRYRWGGVCFFQAYPVCQAMLTNRLQSVSRIPVMVAIDGEWGLGMRLDSILLYPRQMALGASRDTEAIYEMGDKQNAYLAYKRAGSSSGSTYRTKFNARIKQSAVFQGDNIKPEVNSLKSMTRYDRNKDAR